MDFNDTSEEAAFRKEVRTFCDEVLAPVAHRLNTTPESRDSFPRELFRAMADAGLYRIPFPADVGGRGLEFPTLATLTVLEEIAYYSPGLAEAGPPPHAVKTTSAKLAKTLRTSDLRSMDRIRW